MGDEIVLACRNGHLFAATQTVPEAVLPPELGPDGLPCPTCQEPLMISQPSPS